MPMEERELVQAQKRVEKAIRTAIVQKELKQSELAKMLNVSRGTMSRAISGDSNPQSLEIRKKLYKILGMEGE